MIPAFIAVKREGAMKTNKTAAAVAAIWVFAITLAMTLAFGPSAKATDLPSSISSASLTPDRACRLELYRDADPRWTLVDMRCLRAGDGLQTALLAKVFTLTTTGLGCPGDLSLPFDPRAATAAKASSTDSSVLLWVDGRWLPMPVSGQKSGTEYFSIRSFTSTTLAVAVGFDQSALLNGGGTLQTWHVFQPVVSRAPYTCGPAAPMRFRVFGR